MLDEQHLRRCAYVVAEEIRRRNIAAIPVPQALTDLHRALADELSVQQVRRRWQQDVAASGHDIAQTLTGAGGLESTADFAARLGLSERTARRRAAASGAQRIGNRWVFPRQGE